MAPELNTVEQELDAIEALCNEGAMPGALERMLRLERVFTQHLAPAEALLALIRQLRRAIEAGDRAAVGPVASDLRMQLADFFSEGTASPRP